MNQIIYRVILLGLSLFWYVSADEEQFLNNPKYLSNEDVKELFENLKNEYPKLCDYQSIGKSVQGRDLWVIRLSSDVPVRSSLKPMFKYVANMHGDETVGRELVIFLAQYLLHNYKTNSRVKQLLDTVDIYLMPSLNPDGFASSVEGSCDSQNDYKGRNNANNVDLNRDFPDQFDNDVDKNVTRQPETLSMMKWILDNSFVLSGNLHGGAVVASYPYDDTRTYHGDGNGHESKSPDDALFKKLALTYAQVNPQMHAGDTCKPENFSQGITNGAFWYEVKGGMQDFNYVRGSCMEVTLELSCCKFPNPSELPAYWANNKEALISFIEAARWGVKGYVKDINFYEVPHAEIETKGIAHNVTSNQDGEYWRLLLPGTYEIRASAPGYSSSSWHEFTVAEGSSEAVIVNLTLIETKAVAMKYDPNTPYYDEGAAIRITKIVLSACVSILLVFFMLVCWHCYDPDECLRLICCTDKAHERRQRSIMELRAQNRANLMRNINSIEVQDLENQTT